MKAALGFAVLALGGTALAARTGSLPGPVQERAHTMFSDVGVPRPDPSRSARVTAGAVTTPAVPPPTPRRTATPTPSKATTLELCRVWDAARRDPAGKAVPAPTRKTLAAAAGGMPEIDDFCAELLGDEPATGKSKDPGPTGSGKADPGPTGSGKADPTPSHPGQGQGKGNGNGNGKSRGPRK